MEYSHSLFTCRKEQRRQQKQRATTSTFEDDMDWLMRETESGHALAATVSGCTGMNVDLLFFEAPKQNKGASRGAPPESIFDSLLGTSSAPAMGAQSRLPRNAERFTFKGYEEIHVPPMKAAGASIANWDLVRIDAMPAFTRSCFKGYTALNVIQSKIYETAMFKDENVLVCAPTGAYKEYTVQTRLSPPPPLTNPLDDNEYKYCLTSREYDRMCVFGIDIIGVQAPVRPTLRCSPSSMNCGNGAAAMDKGVRTEGRLVKAQMTTVGV